MAASTARAWGERPTKLLGKLGQYRVVVIIADILYAVFLFIRPIIQFPLQIYDFFKKKV